MLGLLGGFRCTVPLRDFAQDVSEQLCHPEFRAECLAHGDVAYDWHFRLPIRAVYGSIARPYRHQL